MSCDFIITDFRGDVSNRAEDGTVRPVSDTTSGLTQLRTGPAPTATATPQAGVVVCHGFTGTPFEMSLVGDALTAAGFAVELPTLAGHGSDHAMLGRTRWVDWVASADRARQRLVARLGPQARIGICGLSMGGLIALELARRYPDDVRAVAGLSVALHLVPALDRALAVLGRVPILRALTLPKLGGSDCLDPEMKERDQQHKKGGVALPALFSLVDFGIHVSAGLGDVTAPLLLMHGQNDHTIPFSCMDEIARSVSSTALDTIALPRSYHLITLDVERERVCEAVVHHFRRHLQTPES